MSDKECPLPNVKEALAPFIKSRIEVAAIRDQFQTHLHDNLKCDPFSLSGSTLNASAIIKSHEDDSVSESLTGIHKTYWKALKAHEAAQAKYDSLREELELLKPGDNSTPQPRSTNFSTLEEHYLPLIRLGEKYRKLRVVERAFSTIYSVDNSSTRINLEDQVIRQIGDQPEPPGAQMPTSEIANPDIDVQILGLKRAVISSKRRLEEKIIENPPDSSLVKTVAPEKAKLLGLQQALQELTIWMENQLTVIAAVDATQSRSRNGGDVNGVNGHDKNRPEILLERIDALYDDYLEARSSLIHALRNSEPSNPNVNADMANIFKANKDKSASNSYSKSIAEVVLPRIPVIAETKQEEQSLLQQQTYIRQKLMSSEGSIDSLLRRLADESHMVLPGAVGVETWANAANESSVSETNSIQERLRMGLESSGDAQKILSRTQTAAGSLDGLT